MINLQFSVIILLFYSLNRVSGYAYYMLNAIHCKSTPLKLGYSPIMAFGGTVVSDTSGKKITAVRTSSGVSLTSGSTCNSGETLTIGVNSFKSSTGSLVMEAHGIFFNALIFFSIENHILMKIQKHIVLGGAKFVSGTDCTAGGANSRVAATPSQNKYFGISSTTFTAQLVMPASGSVTIWVGWAATYGDVSLLPSFVLNIVDPAASASPSSKPVSSLPLSLTPSGKPTNQPAKSSVSPTKSPSSSPTKTTTRSPTKTPSRSPTRTLTRSPTKTTTSSPTKTPSRSPTKTLTRSPTKTTTRGPTKTPTRSPNTRKPTAKTTISPMAK